MGDLSDRGAAEVPPGSSFILDTVVLTYPAQANVLPTLRKCFQSDSCYRPNAVTRELQRCSVNTPALLEPWIEEEKYDPQFDDLVMEILEFLGGEGEQNLGEAECIGLARQLKSIVVTDDHGAHTAAFRYKVESFSTPEILERAIKLGWIQNPEAVTYIDAIKSILDEDGQPKNRGIPFSTGEKFIQAYGLG